EVDRLVATHGSEPPALMDIARGIQAAEGCVSPVRQREIAERLDMRIAEVRAFVGFYSFLTEEPQGSIVIRLCDDVVDRMKGFDRVRDAFEEALGVSVGETTPDGAITLTTTPCIGLSDQAPAALIGDVPVPFLSSDRARDIVSSLRVHADPTRLVTRMGDGKNRHPLVRSMVRNNLERPGTFIFGPEYRGEAIRKALSMTPFEVIRTIKTARLRGRGGAGFPTGMKWEFTRVARGARKFIVCNADEGEPGTFKDRVILTELPDRVIAGMTVAGYALGAREGLFYLRGEYAYLRPYLEDVLERRRADGLLGRDILGKRGFDFDVEIRMGAGSYLCGEETALLNSCEGRPGDARDRPPFPAESGYLGFPTSVNNVETLCCVAKILEHGAATFAELGLQQSTGTKVLSVSGDCTRPGIYEVPFGTTLEAVLEMSGGDGAGAVLVGGPSGTWVSPEGFGRRIAFEDLATGGAIVVFGPDRDLLVALEGYADFFAEESCGYCTPCRVGTQLIQRYLQRFREGRADQGDLDGLLRVARTLKTTSRCGLGQTAGNPVLTTLQSFSQVLEAGLPAVGTRRAAFDLEASVAGARALRGGDHV
ncbi:MAG: NADH:ubiquinone oxidoreductase, partial [Gemmatimonadetes bacterium]|nr:NADH:ubiquinone oxidoreductase [Gemmatimonadota bacterium]